MAVEKYDNIEDRSSGDIKREIARFNTHFDLFWEQEYRIYQKLGIKNGMSILELGCGSGRLLEYLIPLLPDTTYQGLDQNSSFIVHAQSLRENREYCNCTFSTGSIESYQLREASCDIVIIRMVLSCCRDPKIVLSAARRVLKPGGFVVVFDADSGIIEQTSPECPVLDELYKAYCSFMRDSLFNPIIGRELPSLLHEANFSEVDFNLLTIHNAVNGDSKVAGIIDPHLSTNLVNAGYLRKNALADIAVQWKQMLARKGHSFFRIVFAAVGRKGLPLLHKVPAEMKNTQINTDNRLSPVAIPSRETVAASLCTVIANDMEIPVTGIQTDVPVNKSGIDSIAIVSLSMFIKDEWHIEIPIAKIYSDKTLLQIAEEIHLHLKKNEIHDSPLLSLPENTVSEEGII